VIVNHHYFVPHSHCSIILSAPVKTIGQWV
jgi:hypothetical protein